MRIPSFEKDLLLLAARVVVAMLVRTVGKVVKVLPSSIFRRLDGTVGGGSDVGVVARIGAGLTV